MGGGIVWHNETIVEKLIPVEKAMLLHSGDIVRDAGQPFRILKLESLFNASGVPRATILHLEPVRILDL